MCNRKYKVVDDWYRYGKSWSASYKGPCGVKFYGGLHGERRSWSREYANLSAKQKDFLAHGAFNIVNPQWETIKNYFFFEQAAAFPKALRVYLYDISTLAELHGHSQGSGTNRHWSIDFVNLVVSLIFGRTDTLVFLYERKERRLHEISLNEELIRKKFSSRNLKKIVQTRKNGLIFFPLENGGASISNFIAVRQERDEVASPWDAVKAASHRGKISKKASSSGALKMFLDHNSSASCDSVIKWYVKNNDPRTNISVLKYPNGSVKGKEKSLSTFLYLAHTGVSDRLKVFLKKEMGFCAVNGSNAIASAKTTSLHSTKNLISSATNVQYSIDNYCRSF